MYVVFSLFLCFLVFFSSDGDHRDLHSFPTRRSSDLDGDVLRHEADLGLAARLPLDERDGKPTVPLSTERRRAEDRSEEHTSELQSHSDLVCRLLLEKKKKKKKKTTKKTTNKQQNANQ